MKARELIAILIEGDNLDRDIKFVVHSDTIRDLHVVVEKEEDIKPTEGILFHGKEEFHFDVKEVNLEDFSEVMLSVD